MAPQRNHHKALGASLALASARPSALACLKVAALDKVEVVEHADPGDAE